MREDGKTERQEREIMSMVSWVAVTETACGSQLKALSPTASKAKAEAMGRESGLANSKLEPWSRWVKLYIG